MHIAPEQYSTAYNSILAQSRSSNNPASPSTWLLVAPDPDALCAARILHELLKTDYVNNTVVPVRHWEDLRQMYDRLTQYEVRTLVLINLGATSDLSYLLEYLPSNVIVHVIDSHRPYELRNLYEDHPHTTAIFRDGRRNGASWDELKDHPYPAIVVWGDKEDEETREDMRDVFEALQFEPPYDPDDSSDDDSDEEDEEEEEEEEGEEDGDENVEGSKKRRRGSQEPPPVTKAQKRRFRARQIRYYNQGTFTGQSVANLAYLLAVDLRRADEDLVWLAVLGLTFQFMNALTDRGRYDDYISLFASEVDRVSVVPVANGHLNGNGAADPMASSGPNDRSIRPSDELRFCLFRHWNLYDSMFHSAYVAGKMRLWKEKGPQNLSGLLAKMGYSLQQSRETYAHMDADLKSRLFANVDTFAPEYGMTDLSYPSFIRKSGYRSDLSASDVVEGLAAILEAATGVRWDYVNIARGGGAGTVGAGSQEWMEGIKRWGERVGSAMGGDAANGVNGGAVNGQNRKPGEEQDKGNADEEQENSTRDWRTKNFWFAWDALGKDTSLLRDALPLSMALHRAVTAQGTYIMDKQAVRSLRTYRLVVVKEGPHLEVFRHPSTLLRLALWLVDTFRDAVREIAKNAAPAGGDGARTRRKDLPVVVASLDETTDRYTIVGVKGAEDDGDVRKNPFAQAFQRAAQAVNVDEVADQTFSSTTVTVKKDVFQKFLNELAIE
ncbi:CDC45-like protein [Meredithblackwellia eburnea MCA 4105]